MTARVKVALAAVALAGVGLWWYRRPRALVGICVSGSTGPDACGGDVAASSWWPPSWSGTAEPIATVPKGEEWGDPPR